MTRTFKGWHMAVITVTFFTVIIAVNITLAVFAKTSWTGLVVENSYVASQSFNRDATVARQQQAVGWQMVVEVTREMVRVSLHDRANQALSGLNVRMKLQRPVTETEDRVITLPEVSAGLYSSGMPLHSGIWIADVTAEGRDHKPVRFVQRVYVK